MDWLVIEVLYLRATGTYALVVQGGLLLKMQAEVSSVFPVQRGDILSPVQNAVYLLNGDPGQCVSIISASAFSATSWRVLNKLAKNGSQNNT